MLPAIDKELRMADQSNATSSSPTPPPARTCRGRRGVFFIALLAVAVAVGLTANMLTTAFGQGFAWHHDGFMGGIGGPLTPAQIDDRIDKRRISPRFIDATRVYTAQDARDLFNVTGVDIEAIAPHVDGKFVSGFVRASKPVASQAACCATSCCT